MDKIQPWQLKQRQALPLELKEGYTAKRIKSWYEYWQGEVYVSFSGGKDSTVLLNQVRKLYPEVPGVFVDTGLEYPEIRDFVKTVENITWLKPKMLFPDIIKKHGYPVVSKRQARYIHDLQNPTKRNKATRNLRLTGLNRKGIMCPTMKLSKKWHFLVDCGFKISDRCCDIIKKQPLDEYVKKTGKKPFTGMMASESNRRELQYKRHGCNAFNIGKPISWPMAFWCDKDIWGYIKKNALPYSKIYDMGETRTGCMFCMFGVHLEKEPNRFQRMEKTHPKQYDYCINKLGCGDILKCMNVPIKRQIGLFE